MCLSLSIRDINIISVLLSFIYFKLETVIIDHFHSTISIDHYNIKFCWRVLQFVAEILATTCVCCFCRLRYVEQELAKRRGKNLDTENEENDVKSAEDELYRIPDHLKVSKLYF